MEIIKGRMLYLIYCLYTLVSITDSSGAAVVALRISALGDIIRGWF